MSDWAEQAMPRNHPMRHKAPTWIIVQNEWITEDELPKGYPYNAMWRHSKLGPDGLGGTRIFPKVISQSRGNL